MSTETQKLERDLCRCCHSEGSFKSVHERYISLDIQQMVNKDNLTLIVYSDMLRECFDIELAPVTEALNHTASAICDACIQRLQDATQFKHQVLECERRFRDQYLKLVGKASPEVDVKLEVSVPEPDVADNVMDNIYHHNGSKRNNSDSIKAHNDHGDNITAHDEHCESIMADDGINSDEDFTSGGIGVKEFKVKDEEKNSHFKVKKKAKVKNMKPRKVKLTKSKAMKKKNAALPPNPAATSNNNETTDTCKDVIKTKRRSPLLLSEDIDYKRVGDMIQCCRCEYEHEDISRMKYHVKRSHINIPQHTCSHCFKTFLTWLPFMKHKLEVHNIDDRFKCNACDNVFNYKVQLRKHISGFHMLGEKHKCDVCDYESFHTAYIKKHKRTHENAKNFHCKYCRKSFKRRTTLQFHERIHTGDKRKVCQECGQAFVQKASLNYHMTKYHPEVNF